jgi:hypothetical protein
LENCTEILETKLKLKLSHDPATPLFGIHPKEIKSVCGETSTLIFIATLFTIAKQLIIN